MKNNFRDRRESSVCGIDTTAKTATSLITKQLIKGAKRGEKTARSEKHENTSRLPSSFEGWKKKILNA